MTAVKQHLLNWKANPRRWEINYVGSRLRDLVAAQFAKTQASTGEELLVPPIEAEYVDILFDPEFRRSVDQVKDYTCLDVARLANLWTSVRMSGPGIFIEAGSYKGGTALHICNAMQPTDQPFYCFDPFEKGGFEQLGECDAAFSATDFTDTRYEAVVSLLSAKPNAKAIQGFFPAAAEGLSLRDIAFCHLDVDTYNATKASLEYLAPRLAARALVVLDDFDHRETPGVRKALMEFLANYPGFFAIPMFPCQAALVPKSFLKC
jgi:hypothetical protein